MKVETLSSAETEFEEEYDVGKYAKLLERVLNGRFDANMRFKEIVQLL